MLTKFSVAIGLLTCALYQPYTALADDAPLFSPDLLVTASRLASNTPGDGKLMIGRDTIEAIQPLSLGDLVNQLPGVRAFSKGGPSGQGYLSIRGGESNFTLVTLDGVKVNDPSNSQGGVFDFSLIDPELLESVEVSTGAASSIHGSEALSGVIALQLRQFNKSSSSLWGSAEGGSHNFVNLKAGGYTATSHVSALIAGSWSDSGSLDVNGALERGQVFGRLSAQSGNAVFRFLGLYSETDRSAFPEDSGGARLAVNRTLETRSNTLALGSFSAALENTLVQPKISVSLARTNQASQSPGIAPGVLNGVPPLTADGLFERLEIIAQATTSPFKTLKIVFGGDYQAERADVEGTIDFGILIPTAYKTSRKTLSGFSEAEWRPDSALSVKAGVRFDALENGDTEFTGHARATAALWGDKTHVSFSWSNGFKTPSLFALSFPLTANPNLRPEQSRSFDLSLHQRLGSNATLTLSAYHNRYRDLIDFDPDAFTTVNRARVTTKGIEASLEWRPHPTLLASSNMAYLDVSRPQNAAPLRFRPQWKANGSLDWTFLDTLAARIDINYISAFFDSSVPTGSQIVEGHTLVNLSSRWQIVPALRLTLHIDNLLDETYDSTIGFKEPGRTVRVSARAQF